MAQKSESRGTCFFCGETIFKRSITNHLEKCTKRLEAIQAAGSGSQAQDKLWHLRVQDVYIKEYWLDLEMVGSASLEKLDFYLRAIWLECCSHLSKFTIGGWGGKEIGKTRKANNIFESGLVLRHLYDYGTTSETDIKVVNFRIGARISKNPIYLMARNLPPVAHCQECGKPAAWLCIECISETDTSGLLCDEHKEEHPHDNYGEPMRIFNSPRVGMCGYDGPAMPPY